MSETLKALTSAERVELEKRIPRIRLFCEGAIRNRLSQPGIYMDHVSPQETLQLCSAYEAALHTIGEQEKAIVELHEALNWCMDNLGGGIEWGGPFDKAHKQGVYHCTHCDARWKPEGDGTEHHKPDCGLERARKALEGK